MLGKKMLGVFEELEKKKRLLKINGKLGSDGPRPELYNKCSGVIPSKVYTIGAFSNVGKSKFAYAHTAYFLKQGKKVLFINLEVVADECLRGIIQAHDNLDFKEYMDWDLTEEKLQEYENLEIRDDLYKMEDIVKCIEESDADIVFIDFVQNIDAGGGNLYEQSAKIAKTIQQTAIKTKKTIYSLSQLSNSTAKEVQNEMNDITMLKGGGEYYASSDVIFILSRPQNWDNRMCVKIEKNKFGPKASTIVLDADLSSNHFTFIEYKDE